MRKSHQSESKQVYSLMTETSSTNVDTMLNGGEVAEQSLSFQCSPCPTKLFSQYLQGAQCYA